MGDRGGSNRRHGTDEFTQHARNLALDFVIATRVTWHQFRHIHSSLLNDLNVPVKIAQEQLGHESIATTMNIYTHAVDASHRKAIEAVERELFGVLDRSGLQTAAGLENTPPASDSVN